PEVGAQVWVEFEAGNLNQPIWTGTFWQASGDPPTEAALSPPTTRVLKTFGTHPAVRRQGRGGEVSPGPSRRHRNHGRRKRYRHHRRSPGQHPDPQRRQQRSGSGRCQRQHPDHEFQRHHGRGQQRQQDRDGRVRHHGQGHPGGRRGPAGHARRQRR
ncbi:phage baseplate assembly protein V, partial [Desulfosarcina cetonica]|uniref:phage baseplate assembly protein V n=1 Tax=Desulfosarcina cetonica TaxID=90730 RepID=UPI003BEF4A9E